MNVENLISDMSALGLSIESDPVIDGNIHRVSVSGKNRKNGWYTGIIINGNIYASFGRWDTGETVKWNSNGHKKISDSDMELVRKNQESARLKKVLLQSAAAKAAVKMWAAGVEPDTEHGYIKSKSIQPYEARQFSDYLIVKIINQSGKIVNLQRIYPDGQKKFLYGGEISGCAAIIPGDDRLICVCEGFATACSIRESTGFKTIVAFNTGNLKSVVVFVRQKYPDHRILICGDNDESGAGEKYGREAAKAAGAGFIMPNVVGHDFNDMASKKGYLAVNEVINDFIDPDGVYTAADVESEVSGAGFGLNIPKTIWNVPGLILDGIEAAKAAGAPDIMQYNLPVVLSMIARSIAGKLCFDGQYPSIYSIKVGGTSTGKTDIDNIFKTAIAGYGIERFYGPSDFASGPGLARAMSEDGRGQCLVQIDEMTYLFKRYSGNDPVGNGKISIILELYTASGRPYEKVFGDKSNIILINNPVLILTGNATPGIFDEIKEEDLNSGLMQRFDFWVYDGQIPYRVSTMEENPAMERFLAGIAGIMGALPVRKNNYDLRSMIGNYGLSATPNAKKILNDFSVYITDGANGYDQDDSGRRGMISRQYHLSKKYALIHAAATRPVEYLYDPIGSKDINWGISVAEMLCKWKVAKLSDKINMSDFHRYCTAFKEAIKAAIKNGKPPTQRILCDRKRILKGIDLKFFNSIVDKLVACDDVIVDNSRRVPRYFLKKH